MKVALQWLSNNALESYRPVFPKFIEFFPAPPPQKKKTPSRVNPAVTLVVPLVTVADVHTDRYPYVVSSWNMC